MAMMLKPQEKLKAITKEWHTRKHRGKNVCYLILDREQHFVLFGQKLPLLTDFINTNIVSDPCFKVSTPGLYTLLDSTDGRTGGYHKLRWRVSSIPLERGGEVLENIRHMYENVIVVGSQDCYCTE